MNVVLHEVKVVGELELDIFLKTTQNDKYRCPSGQFPLFVNDL